jgi:hypothetical protein
MRGEGAASCLILSGCSFGTRCSASNTTNIARCRPDAALKELSPLFEQMYSAVGRPSIPPERLLKASLLMALYTVRSERLFCEQLDYNFLFRWFLDLEVDEAGFDHSTFSRNRARLLEHAVAVSSCAVVAHPQTALRRALHGGRDAGRGVGFAQELQAQGGRPE